MLMPPAVRADRDRRSADEDGVASFDSGWTIRSRCPMTLFPGIQLGPDEAKERFLQEARAASVLDHSEVRTIHVVGETDDGQHE